jgi:hypothetical protein
MADTKERVIPPFIKCLIVLGKCKGGRKKKNNNQFIGRLNTETLYQIGCDIPVWEISCPPNN